MSGRHRSKPAREIFLTSSSLSFSSLSSSSIVSWDDAIEINKKASRPSFEEQNISEMSSVVTQVRMPPSAPSPPLKLRPAQVKNKGLYDPDRIPASIFSKNVDLNWSEISNDSLFSLKMDGCRMSNFRQSNIKPEDLFMSGEFLAYSPFLSIKLEDPEEENISEIEEVRTAETELTIAETRTHQKNSSLSAPDVLCSTKPSKSYSKRHYIFGQAPPSQPPTKVQPFNLPVMEKKSKKRKQTMKSKQKKKKDKKKKTKCCILSWLSSKSSNSKSDSCCFKWRNCGCYCTRP